MNILAKRLLIILVLSVGFSAVVYGLSQSVTYKPWGVSDSNRERYDQLMEDLEERDKIRELSKTVDLPSLVCLTRQHSFGLIEPGEECRHTIAIQNGGKKDLEIAVRETSTDNLSAVLDKKVVAPGDYARCKLNWSPKFVADNEDPTASIVIESNDPLCNTLQFSLDAKWKQNLVLPKQISFGKHDIDDVHEMKFVVYSQLHEDFEIVSLESDQNKIEWFTSTADDFAEELDAASAVGAHQLTVRVQPSGYEGYSGTIVLNTETPSGKITRQIEYSGAVRPPIGFYGPTIDQVLGLDLGTIESGERRDHFVTVRSRGDKSRKIEVLDYEPKALEMELEATELDGAYRLRITVPEDCPDLNYQLNSNRGYVEIGDPKSAKYKNWLPIYIAVTNTNER